MLVWPLSSLSLSFLTCEMGIRITSVLAECMFFALGSCNGLYYYSQLFAALPVKGRSVSAHSNETCSASLGGDRTSLPPWRPPRPIASFGQWNVNRCDLCHIPAEALRVIPRFGHGVFSSVSGLIEGPLVQAETQNGNTYRTEPQ